MLFSESSEACPVCELRGALAPENDPPSVREAASVSLLRFEHYRVLQNEAGTPIELGHGAMGVTYKAVDVNLQRPVALKIINAPIGRCGSTGQPTASYVCGGILDRVVPFSLKFRPAVRARSRHEWRYRTRQS